MIRKIRIQDIQELFKKRKWMILIKVILEKLGILGGLLKYSGAIKLAYMSLSSLRSGCGLVRVIVPENIVSSIVPCLLEQTLYPYHYLEVLKRLFMI